jgi:S-adenosylmethionine synthetase
MASRSGSDVDVTISVPQVSSEVNSAEEYFAHLEEIRTRMTSTFCDEFGSSQVRLSLNPGDDLQRQMLYMKYTGSSVESGDEGVVGRGNRIGGLMAACRPYSMEGLGGKNPAYHAGKLYSAAAWDIAQRVWAELEVPSEVFVVSQMDRPLNDPWLVTVRCYGRPSKEEVRSIVEQTVTDVKGLTTRILSGFYPLA